LLDIDDRFARFAEGLEVISLLLYSDIRWSTPAVFIASIMRSFWPRPQRRGGPPILIGETAKSVLCHWSARLADEWNAVYVTTAEFARLNVRLDEWLQAEGREKGEVKRSLMTGFVFGRDQAEINRKVAERTKNKRNAAQLRDHGVIVGTGQTFANSLPS